MNHHDLYHFLEDHVGEDKLITLEEFRPIVLELLVSEDSYHRITGADLAGMYPATPENTQITERLWESLVDEDETVQHYSSMALNLMAEITRAFGINTIMCTGGQYPTKADFGLTIFKI